MNQHTTLSILQYNVRKSRDMVMATLLRDPQIHEYDILAIQEPWRNPYTATTHHPAKDVSHLCYQQQGAKKGLQGSASSSTRESTTAGGASESTRKTSARSSSSRAQTTRTNRA
jgi:hypothetical protein